MRKIMVVITSVILTGCFDISLVSNEPINKLVADSLNEAKRDVATSVIVIMPELPEREFRPYKGGKYTDPLAMPAVFNISDVAVTSDVVATYKLEADPTRPKGYIPEKLEQDPLSAFKMIGVITKLDGSFSALLEKESGGEIITVNEGDYIGRNFGQIVQISEASIKISEKVAVDREQTWKEHFAYIDLNIKK